jgi:hypothetical protein
VNALENVVKPKLENTIAYIKVGLRSQEERSRLDGRGWGELWGVANRGRAAPSFGVVPADPSVQC